MKITGIELENFFVGSIFQRKAEKMQQSDRGWLCNICHPKHIHERRGEPLCRK